MGGGGGGGYSGTLGLKCSATCFLALMGQFINRFGGLVLLPIL